MAKKCVLGIDLGTSSCKVLAIDEECKVVAESSGKYPLYIPKPGWSEQNPDDWWKEARSILKGLIKKLKEKNYEISGIGLSGTMSGLILLDKNGKVLRPCIMWNDQRSAKQAIYATEKLGGLENVLKLINNAIRPGHTLPKLLWVMENEPEIYSMSYKLLLPKDYLAYKLTGRFVTDVSYASGTAMFDVKNRKWCDDVVNTFDLNPELLPDCVESPTIIGEVSGPVARELGLESNTPVVSGGGDSALQTVAAGSVNSSITSVIIGTAGIVGAVLDSYSKNPDGLAHVYCSVIPRRWYAYCCSLAAGGSLEWFRQTLAGLEEQVAKLSNRSVFDILCEEAAQSALGSGGVFFMPFLSGERCPFANPNARGVFIGLSLKTRKNDLVRSVLEGVAFNLRRGIELLYENFGVKSEKIYLSGGAILSDVWRQIFAEVFGKEVSVLRYSEKGAALGAAILAGVGAKIWKSVEEVVGNLDIVYRNKPVEENIKYYEKLYRIYKDLYEIIKPAFNLIVEGRS